MAPVTFDRSKLSARENEILELAISGLTDQQTALRLKISASTVNSYWVRIRGKLGSKSRTELVALALRLQAKQEVSELLRRTQEYEREAGQRKQLEGDLASAELYRSALESMPEAILIRDRLGRILYTNDLLLSLFGYGPGELVGQPVEMLVPNGDENPNCPSIATCLAMGTPKRYGHDEVLFARNREGFYFRVVLLLRTTPTSHGPITVCAFQRFATKGGEASRSDGAERSQKSGEKTPESGSKSGVTFR